MSLLTLGLVGIIRTPMQLHKSALKRMEAVEADRIASWTFTEIRPQLRWADIPAFRETGKTVSLSDARAELSPQKSKAFPRNYRLKTLQEKQNANGHTYRLVSVRIEVDDRVFTYRMTVGKKL